MLPFEEIEFAALQSLLLFGTLSNTAAGGLIALMELRLNLLHGNDRLDPR